MINRTSFHRSSEPPPALPSDGYEGKRERMGYGAEDSSPRNGHGVVAPPRSGPTQRNGERFHIVIADNHPIFRDGLRRLIESQPGLHVTGESSVGLEAVRLARDLKPDILLLDLDQPQDSGLQVLNDLARLSPPVRILVLAAAVEEDSILEAFYLGAQGIVLKGSPQEVLLKSIHSVIAGHYWLDSESIPIVIQALRKSIPSRNGVTCGQDYGLTPRELEIAGKVANGSSNKEMGQEFSISERTVKHHLTNIFDKLGISTRLELAVFALEHGLANKE